MNDQQIINTHVSMLFSPFLFARVTPESSRHSYNNSRPSSRTELLLENKKPSYIDNLGIMDDQKRRLSEAGVNRRPSAAHVLTEGELILCQISFSKKGRMGLGPLILFMNLRSFWLRKELKESQCLSVCWTDGA